MSTSNKIQDVFRQQIVDFPAWKDALEKLKEEIISKIRDAVSEERDSLQEIFVKVQNDLKIEATHTIDVAASGVHEEISRSITEFELLVNNLTMHLEEHEKRITMGCDNRLNALSFQFDSLAIECKNRLMKDIEKEMTQRLDLIISNNMDLIFSRFVPYLKNRFLPWSKKS
jgi:hypothetical protein